MQSYPLSTVDTHTVQGRVCGGSATRGMPDEDTPSDETDGGISALISLLPGDRIPTLLALASLLRTRAYVTSGVARDRGPAPAVIVTTGG